MPPTSKPNFFSPREVSSSQQADFFRIFDDGVMGCGAHGEAAHTQHILAPFFVENFRRRQACAVASYLFRASRGVLGCGVCTAKLRKQKYSHPFFFKIFGRQQVRAASTQFSSLQLRCARQSHADGIFLMFFGRQPACAASKLKFSSLPLWGCWPWSAHGKATQTQRFSQSLEEETAKQRTKRHNLWYSKARLWSLRGLLATFAAQTQMISSSFVQISWPLVAPVVSEGIFSSIHSSRPEMNISEYDILLSSKKGPGRLIHPPTCENHGAAQTRNIPPSTTCLQIEIFKAQFCGEFLLGLLKKSDISKIFSSRGVAYNPEEIS
ncbi:hypothetical protein C8J57DRAFT_1224655 [Mycena rebaudengoi]|nr:hypothetical protein C8J57DRAFT_1224655 [Mycena rebaudengoi]